MYIKSLDIYVKNMSFISSNCIYTDPYTIKRLTNHNEGVVDVDAAEAIGGFTVESTSILSLHLFYAQCLMRDPEAHPSAVDIAAIFTPHDEGWRVTFNRTLELHGASDPHRLPMYHLL